MRRLLRRRVVVGLTVGLALSLLAGVGSDVGARASDEGDRRGGVSLAVAPEGSEPLIAAVSPADPAAVPALVAPGAAAPAAPRPDASVAPAVASGVISGASGPAIGGEAESGPAASLTIRLSDGDESDGGGPPTARRVDGLELDAEQIRAVLDRLPPWVADDGDGTEFNRPAVSLPPPRTGRTVDQPFPAGPDVAAPVVDPGPLKVLRAQPEGEVGIAPFVSVTFNQPMVPLATLGQLDDFDVPARITPPLPGRWQWIGTRTLRFEHDQEVFDRLPMATTYTVEIPAGTESQSGAVLAETFRFGFETPAPSVVQLIPNHDSLELRPVFLATFDQRVEPSEVLDAVTLEADGRKRAIRLARADEIEANEEVRDAAEYALEGTWVAFRPVLPLEPDIEIIVTVGPHVPSVEGPNTSEGTRTVTARTYAPLKVTRSRCSSWPWYWSVTCGSGSSLDIDFNNSLDAATVNGSTIFVTPEIPDAYISATGKRISISGSTVGGTVYRVAVSGRVADEFGQRLGGLEIVEIEIHEALPVIYLLGGSFTTVDPLTESQTVPIIVRQWDEVRVRLYAADPGDFDSFLTFVRSFNGSDSPLSLDVPWPLAADRTIATGIDGDDLTEVPVSLAHALNGRHGHLVMIVEGVGTPRGFEDMEDYSWDEYRHAVGFPQIAWLQDTDIGVDLVEDGLDVVLWATDLRSGEPLAGVEVQLGDREPPLVSDADGLVRAPIGADGFENVIATLGTDSAISPVRVWESLKDQTIWYTADDRGMYRPGETLRLKGWVRHLDITGDGGLEFLPSGTSITYAAYGPRGNELGSGAVRTDGLGGFDLTLELSDGANLGWSRIHFELPGGADGAAQASHSHRFQVQEFRRPEFEVEARQVSAGPHFVDEPAFVAVDARYYSGGPLSDAEVRWTVSTGSASYSPPNWGDFTFGVWRPWWYQRSGGSAYARQTFSGTTDSTGSHPLRIDLEDDGDGLPVSVTAVARVTDANLQRWAAETRLLVHSADLYVGLRSARYFVRAGDGIDIEAIVTDLDGDPVAGRAFKITAERVVYRHVDGDWTDVVLDAETCEAVSRPVPVACEFAATDSGRYRITARVVDDSGRTNRSEITRWVAGAERLVSSRNVELTDVELIPDAGSYSVGEVAEILVNSPFATASGLLTITHNRILETRTFTVTGHTAVLRVPIAEDHVPELRLRVDLASVTERTADDGTVLTGAPPRPAHGSGTILLRVPPARKTLEVTAAPAAAVVRPGAATSVDVEVTDADGAPVEGAGVLLVVVDEAVLALSAYELTDPIEVFYRARTARVDSVRGRSSVLLESPHWLAWQIEDELARAGESVMGNDAAFDDLGGSSGVAVDVRQDLNPLAIFEPDAATGADGRVTVELELPDNLTRYRVMAVAVEGAERFGTGESSITARLPLQVRPSLPRFLNYGDRFELPVVVQNQTDASMEVDVVVQTSNLELLGSAGRRVVVPANDRVAVGFAARTVSPGVARLRAAAVSADHADAQAVSLPVYTPATSEAFATYGVVDEGAVIQPVAAPREVIPQFGGLEVNTSSTALSALTDAVLYLADYRYASSDAYAGRIMAIAALRDVLGAFEAEGLASPEELNARVRRDIAELAALQNYDGGFGWWSRGRPSHPYTSIQAMHALVIARSGGFDVPPRVIEDGFWYLRDIEHRMPSYYDELTREMLVAYALYVRALDGEQVAVEARAVWDRRGEELGLEALSRLWQVVDDDGIESEISRIVNNRAVETAGAATFATDYGEDAYLLLHSDRRTDGIVLDALITMAPDSDLIPKAVAGLLAHRVRGRWDNCQENAFILLALGRYFETFEATDPDFVARVWLGDLYAAEHQHSGRSADRGATLVPMSELLDAGDSDLVVQKDGEGRLYYRLGLRYAPDDLDLEALDRGFVVQRSYEAVDDPGDVRLDEDGVWHVRAGAVVRVTVSMVNDSRRTNMALIDPLAAGFEPLNPALAVTGDVDVGDDSGWWWWTWYRHQNLRDDRAEAFASYLWAGTHEYSYVVRATTPGSFVVPPARAEEIYAPEVFGRSGSDRVIVADSR